MLAEMARILKPSGNVFVREPVAMEGQQHSGHMFPDPLPMREVLETHWLPELCCWNVIVVRGKIGFISQHQVFGISGC